MAIVEKTIVYAFPMTSATVVDATVTNLTQITVEIPEASPTFVSVFAEVGFQDIVTATGGTITEYRVGLRLGAAGYTTITELDDIANTGENIAGVLSPHDFTSHFTTNWTGTSMTCDLQVYFDQTTGTTLGMANVTGLLYITYSYDDTAATQIKTVCIPLESLVAALPTTATNFGTSQIPQLTSGGILPENTPVIVDWFLVIEGNEASTAAVDFTISANIDGGAATAFMAQERALASDRYCRWIYRPSVPDPTAAHNLQLWATVAECNHVTVTLYVTYKFTLSGTTRVLNSVIVPLELPSPMINAVGDASRFKREYVVGEPGTITLRQSGFNINYNANAARVLLFRAGGQAYRTYTGVGGVVCGMFCLQHRIDSGSAQGAGITLAAGANDIVIDGYQSTATPYATNINGYIFLNYESDVPAQGIGAASHTIFKSMANFNAGLVNLVAVNSFAIGITPANYWLAAVGVYMTIWNANSGNAYVLTAEYLSGEGPGAGWTDLYADGMQTDAELGCTQIWARARDAFKRFAQDADTGRMDIEAARSFRMFSPLTARYGMVAFATLHHCTYTVAGSITGNNVALPTDLKLIRASTSEALQEQTLTAGTTAFSFTVYDNTLSYYVDAYQDGTHVGRSALGVAA